MNIQNFFISSLVVLSFCVGHGHTEILDEYEITGSGTGFFVGQNGLIATCSHVVKDADVIQVEYKNKSYNANKITENESNDIAIIKIEGEFPFFNLKGSEDVKLGDDVYTIGYPNTQVQGVEPKLTTGTISALSGLRDDPTYYQISVPIQPGNSGGPLLNANGIVIGVISATMDAKATLIKRDFIPQNINYAVKSDYLKILLEISNKKTENIVTPENEKKNKNLSKEESLKRILRIITKNKKPKNSRDNNLGKTTREKALPQVWEEALNEVIQRESLIKAVAKINTDDPFENYEEIKNELPPKFREWMDNWYQNTYAAWLSRGGGLAPGNIKGNPTPYEQEFKRLKNDLSHYSLENLRYLIDSLSYTKFIKTKLTAKGYCLLIEQYSDEWKDCNLSKEQDELLKDLYDKSKKEALSGVSFPSAEIIFHDKVGIAHTDPTISDNKLLITRLFKHLSDSIEKNEKETSYLFISLVTKEPYLVKVPASFLSNNVNDKK